MHFVHTHVRLHSKNSGAYIMYEVMFCMYNIETPSESCPSATKGEVMMPRVVCLNKVGGKRVLKTKIQLLLASMFNMFKKIKVVLACLDETREMWKIIAMHSTKIEIK